jgi:hypothetical protein
LGRREKISSFLPSSQYTRRKHCHPKLKKWIVQTN